LVLAVFNFCRWGIGVNIYWVFIQVEVKGNQLYLWLLKRTHMFDLMSIMNKVKEAQAKVKEAQARLVHLKAEGESGAGMVKVLVNGNRKVISIEMDDSLVNISDKQMLGDLIVAATNKAMEEIEGKIKEELKSATDGMMPNIPGMDFGSMF
jgi:nucleoid-associated protein EbfC